MEHSLQNCCVFVFENKKQKPITVVKDDKKNVHYGLASIGEISNTEDVKNVYGVFTVQDNKENYMLVLETTKGCYHKDLQCTFNNFLDIIFEPQFLTSKKFDSILKRPWVLGEVYEVEVG